MYSKMKWMATIAIALLFSGCASRPWTNEPIGSEVTLAFKTENNLVFLNSVKANGQPGRFLLGTATPVTVIDPRFAEAVRLRPPYVLQLAQKEALQVTPLLLDMRGAGDGIVGADAWGDGAVTIDFVSRLITYQKEGIHSGLMTVFRYDAEPAVTVEVDGRKMLALIDTSSPDTLVLPRASKGRGTAAVTIAGSHFEGIDVGYADVAHAHIGNRLLSRFLITIDYGRHVVGLWRDPRARS